MIALLIQLHKLEWATWFTNVPQCIPMLAFRARNVAAFFVDLGLFSSEIERHPALFARNHGGSLVTQNLSMIATVAYNGTMPRFYVGSVMR